MRFIVALAVLWGATVAPAQNSPASGLVVVLAQFPGFNNYELGTGAFIDHDGLIVTADHVVHHLNPTSSFSSTTLPATEPTKLTIYSPYLGQFFQVDLASSNNLLGGQISSSKWIDAALVRVTLSDVQRVQIQPLDLSPAQPVQGQKLVAYGPKCNNASTSLQVAQGDDCLQTGVVEAVLANDPTVSREYQIQAGTTVGYSGGPLIDQTGRVVGTASYGDVIGDTGVVARQLYLPAAYLLNFLLPGVKPSSHWGGGQGCAFASTIHSLTIADWVELSGQWRSTQSPNQQECDCCCHSMDKMRSQYTPSPLTLQCGAPFACSLNRLYGLANAIKVASASESTGPGTNALVSAFKAAYNPAVLADLPAQNRKEFLSGVGQSLANLSVEFANDKSQTSPDVGSFAVTVLLESQKVKESSSDYDAMSNVFAAYNDETNETAADILSTTTGTDSSALKRHLHVDVNQLKSSITKGAQHLGATK
jgi:hypothetical protein